MGLLPWGALVTLNRRNPFGSFSCCATVFFVFSVFFFFFSIVFGCLWNSLIFSLLTIPWGQRCRLVSQRRLDQKPIVLDFQQNSDSTLDDDDGRRNSTSTSSG